MYQRISHPRRNLLKLNTHFVWATKERIPIIGSEYERDLYRFIESLFNRYEATVHAIGGMPDHVHVLVALSPKYSISEVIKNVKGGSSRHFTEILKPGEWFQWQPNYAAINVSPSHIESVKLYIQNQKQHHAEGTIKARWEETDEADIRE